MIYNDKVPNLQDGQEGTLFYTRTFAAGAVPSVIDFFHDFTIGKHKTNCSGNNALGVDYTFVAYGIAINLPMVKESDYQDLGRNYYVQVTRSNRMLIHQKIWHYPAQGGMYAMGWATSAGVNVLQVQNGMPTVSAGRWWNPENAIILADLTQFQVQLISPAGMTATNTLEIEFNFVGLWRRPI